MPLFLPLTILSSAAAVHITQNMWGQTNRLEKWFVKICWDSCWILRGCLYQAKRCSREPDGFKCDAIIAALVWYMSKAQSCLQRSAVPKCYECTAAVATPSVSLSSLGCIGWNGTAGQTKQTSLLRIALLMTLRYSVPLDISPSTISSPFLPVHV